MEARTMKEIGEALEKIRVAKGWSIEDVAEKSQTLSAETITKIEKGDEEVSGTDFIFLCMALGIENPDEIIYK